MSVHLRALARALESNVREPFWEELRTGRIAAYLQAGWGNEPDRTTLDRDILEFLGSRQLALMLDLWPPADLVADEADNLQHDDRRGCRVGLVVPENEALHDELAALKPSGWGLSLESAGTGARNWVLSVREADESKCADRQDTQLDAQLGQLLDWSRANRSRLHGALYPSVDAWSSSGQHATFLRPQTCGDCAALGWPIVLNLVRCP